jgi:hypothetical protein
VELSDDRFKLVEERRKAAEAVLWQLPALSMAAQAFLLGAALDHNVSHGAQSVLGGVALVSLLATGTVVGFQAMRVTVLTRWLNAQSGDIVRAEVLTRDLARDAPKETRALSTLQACVFGWFPTPLVPWLVLLFWFLVADILVTARVV